MRSIGAASHAGAQIETTLLDREAAHVCAPDVKAKTKERTAKTAATFGGLRGIFGALSSNCSPAGERRGTKAKYLSKLNGAPGEA
jgi:hypothetical protein